MEQGTITFFRTHYDTVRYVSSDLPEDVFSLPYLKFVSFLRRNYFIADPIGCFKEIDSYQTVQLSYPSGEYVLVYPDRNIESPFQEIYDLNKKKLEAQKSASSSFVEKLQINYNKMKKEAGNLEIFKNKIFKR